MITKIAIIGGGAAGMMAAATILEDNKSADIEIHLFEKNKNLGVKVAISGGGRCNVTTGINDKNQLLKKYIRGSELLKFSLAAFPPLKVREWFEHHGVTLKEEEDRRVFPASDVGQDVIKVFERLFTDPRIQLHYLEGIQEVRKVKRGSAPKFLLKSIKAEYESDILVITSGGNAYSKTGSTGDGYAFAKSLGHSVTRLGPSLNSFMAAEQLCSKLQAISFEDAKFETNLSSGEKVSVHGPMIFTHFGISGPVVFEMAAHLAFEKIDLQTLVKVKFMPDANRTFADWDKVITQEISKNSSKLIVNILHEFLPKRFAEELLVHLKIKNVKGAVLTKEERRKIVHQFSGEMVFTLTGRRPGDEFVTAGGVPAKEVEARTLESKIMPNLYFAGEVLDIDGVTGGFNLQSAWATGRMAGLDILRKVS